MEYVIHQLSNDISMSNEQKQKFKNALNNDNVFSQIKHFCENSWPLNCKYLDQDLKFYFKLKEFIYLSNDFLFLNNKIIFPSSLRQEMLALVHKPPLAICLFRFYLK